VGNELAAAVTRSNGPGKDIGRNPTQGCVAGVAHPRGGGALSARGPSGALTRMRSDAD
jgi:hypothetical protein